MDGTEPLVERNPEIEVRGATPPDGAAGPRRDPRAAEIHRALERGARAVELRPAVGRGTALTTARLEDGLACRIEDGRWRLRADMSPKVGGRGSAPDPGVLGRACLASCLAAGYAMWAARRNVPVRELTVQVEADYDVRGELGVDGMSPAYEEMRVFVTVVSEAPEREVAAALREAEARSPWLQMLRAGTRVVREAWFAAPAEAA